MGHETLGHPHDVPDRTVGVCGHSGDNSPLKLLETIPLPGVNGRIDHLSVDVKSQHLFIAALGNNTVEIVDLVQKKRVRTITGLDEPQGIVFAPEVNRLFVANGGNGTLLVYDADSFAVASTLKLDGDADNVRYDASQGQIWVGYGDGALTSIDAKSLQNVSSTKLSGHPESFQLEMSGPRIFVNVPDANHIAVIDRAKQTVAAIWRLGDLRSNFPMALDEADHRIFIGTRNPARMVVRDSVTGTQIGIVNSSGDADDIFYDQLNRRVYLIAGEGFVDIFKQQDPNHYVLQQKLRTAPGARTALLSPELRRLFVAVPHRGNQQAEVRAYVVQPDK